MSRLQELIAELCPDGVEYKALGELGVFMRGSSFQKKHFVEDGMPCIHYGQVHTRFNIATDEVVSYLDESFAAKKKKAQPGDLIIATTSEDDDAVGKAIAWVGDTDVVVSNDAYIYRHELDPKYMAHVFASDLFQEPKRQYITGTKVRRLNDKGMSKIVIPVPPIEVQREVVRILDEYTAAHDELVRQLEEESELFSQRCALSIDEFFDSIGTVESGSLASFCETVSDCPHSTAPDEGEGYPLIRTPNIGKGELILDGVHRVSRDVYVRRTTRVVPRPGDLILAREGSAGNVAIIPDGELVCLGQRTVLIRPDSSKVFSPYLCMLLNTGALQMRLLGKAAGSTVQHINMSDIRNLTVSIPSLEVQRRVFSSLKSFYRMKDEMMSRLVDERALLERQLALVRNQLLSFPEKVA